LRGKTLKKHVNLKKNILWSDESKFCRFGSDGKHYVLRNFSTLADFAKITKIERMPKVASESEFPKWQYHKTAYFADLDIRSGTRCHFGQGTYVHMNV